MLCPSLLRSITITTTAHQRAFLPRSLSSSLPFSAALAASAPLPPPSFRRPFHAGHITTTTTTTMADRVHRVTLLKVPKPEDQQTVLAAYRKLATDHLRNGKPYILSLAVGPAEDDPRAQGYTIVSKTEFASLDDMTYYDNECEAHAGVKNHIKALANGCEGVFTVFFKPQVTGGAAAP